MSTTTTTRTRSRHETVTRFLAALAGPRDDGEFLELRYRAGREAGIGRASSPDHAAIARFRQRKQKRVQPTTALVVSRTSGVAVVTGVYARLQWLTLESPDSGVDVGVIGVGA